MLSHEKSKFKWNQELSKHKMKDIHNLKGIATQRENLERDDVRGGCCHLQTGDNAAAGVMVSWLLQIIKHINRNFNFS